MYFGLSLQLRINAGKVAGKQRSNWQPAHIDGCVCRVGTCKGDIAFGFYVSLGNHGSYVELPLLVCNCELRIHLGDGLASNLELSDLKSSVQLRIFQGAAPGSRCCKRSSDP